MKFNTFGKFIKYIRNEILELPTAEVEGDDLELNIYDNEISIRINSLYNGPQVIYMVKKDKIEVEFFNTEEDMKKGDVFVDPCQVKQVAALINLIEENKEMLNNFLLREE